MGLNDINSLSQSLPLRVYKMELQISHRVCNSTVNNTKPTAALVNHKGKVMYH